MEWKKVQRQVQLLVLLSQKPVGQSVSNLHLSLCRAGFEVDIRTVRRDLTDLIPIFNIQASGDENNLMYSSGAVHFGAISFRFEDMQAFQLLLELAKPYRHIDIGRRMMLFLDQIQSAISPVQKEWLVQAAGILSVNPAQLHEERDVDPIIRHAVEDGIVDKKCIYIRYHAISTNTISERMVEPLCIEVAEGCLHLLAYCRERNDIRDFRFSRILQARLLEEAFVPKTTLLNTYMKNRFRMMGQTKAEKVVIRFTGFSARFVKEYCHSESDTFVMEMDGSLRFERMTSITDELVRWTLGFGEEAVVLEPKELKEKIRQKAYDMLGNYMR